ncbi:MAG TPA: ketoacyl-synthetase C-terminal extension domain-containing protein, partial [Cystobacter sp.]
VTRAMQERVIPRSLKSEPRNPKIPQGIEVVTDNREWPAPAGGAPRRAGVSSFGVGGSNFHAIIEEYKGPPSRPEKKESEPAEGDPKLVAVAGADASACLEQLHALCEQQGPLEDTRHTPEGPWRVAITARTREELRKKRDFLR